MLLLFFFFCKWFDFFVFCSAVCLFFLGMFFCSTFVFIHYFMGVLSFGVAAILCKLYKANVITVSAHLLDSLQSIESNHISCGVSTMICPNDCLYQAGMSAIIISGIIPHHMTSYDKSYDIICHHMTHHTATLCNQCSCYI